MRRFTSLEARIDAAAHRVLDALPRHGLSGALVEFLVFGLKQAWACLFGGLLLALIIATHYVWPRDALLARYDFLFLAALGIQVAMLAGRLETFSEAKVILIFHVVGTAMEVFKTSVGSWIYPEDSFFHIGPVPLFSGFMYAAVGSYLARVSRIFDMRYTNYPPLWTTVLLAVGIYVNFFAHHYTVDIRYGLFALTAVLYLRTVVHYRVFRFRHRMPLLLGFLLVALFIWFAENIGTWSRAWIYPSQSHSWTPVSLGKLGAWYLLMIISFVLVSLVHRPTEPDIEERDPK
ncbi:hypothetical protein NA8A_16873 [Nitratireductor indicus C115]|uniref:DUF817 domain-containing protein n=1 Tax=Nitratireductor indicus C115 TaxID=1231190 RepID=K2P1F3_9HYPH|nr:DUF817 domain-containing protein [Nitratireductor indicus]EKF41186.1 hypothetical protein NA8A_16873 [Nitratireductor indicus C115]SFQ64569.1 Uncharacterized membrane protein YoaT, DUF817 family [Nitratireductor indicus]